MKIIFSVTAFLFLFTVAKPQNTSAKLDELLAAYTKQHKFNGSVMVAQNGRILLEKGYGWKNKNDSTWNDASTVFQIGSVTKQFTSAIILKLEEQGKLSIHDKLSKYFPGYPNGDSITVHNLLTHTSGIYNYTNDGRFMNSEATKPQSHDKMMSLFKDKPLGFSPGTKYSYSNSGYCLLGYIIEKVSGKTWETMMYETILHPLQMNQSGFNFVALKSKDKATGYFFLDTNGQQAASIMDSTVSYAAGSLYSSVGDLYKWERSIYTSKILEQEGWKKAFTPFRDKYAYGWIVDSLYGKKIIWHNGGIYGFNSHLLRFPDEELVIILLANKPTPALTSIANSIGALVCGMPYTIPEERKEIVLADNVLQQYVGVYEINATINVSVTLKGGRLKTQMTNQPELDLFAEKEHHFFLKVVDARVEFIKGKDGKVEGLVISQNGQMTRARKIN